LRRSSSSASRSSAASELVALAHQQGVEQADIFLASQQFVGQPFQCGVGAFAGESALEGIEEGGVHGGSGVCGGR
jgi:hypothetical protein